MLILSRIKSSGLLRLKINSEPTNSSRILQDCLGGDLANRNADKNTDTHVPSRIRTPILHQSVILFL
jgi:hypothetical protein